MDCHVDENRSTIKRTGSPGATEPRWFHIPLVDRTILRSRGVNFSSREWRDLGGLDLSRRSNPKQRTE